MSLPLAPAVRAKPLPTRRADLLARLAEPKEYDVAIIGGGATGLGVALDAAARGLSVVLVESHDFAKGTSSRATKLVHGGVRYLAQGNIALVREALHERSTLLRTAPHLAQPLQFVMPTYRWWEGAFYGLGLKLYDQMAGKAGLGATEFLSRDQTLRLLPTVQSQGLRGGVKYWDGQFDDARLALALARTAASQGALLLNYCPAMDLLHTSGKVSGLNCKDARSGQVFTLRARCVINAAGVWVDEFRHKDGQAMGRSVTPMVAPSQGVHLVVDKQFFPGEHALMVPKTADGRVLFAVPWLGQVILGTTDTPRQELPREPQAQDAEVDFILREAGKYLRHSPTRKDVKSVWVGLRPLVKPADEDGDNTKGLSREHTVLISRSGLVTVTGGKWTTYRAMAEDVLTKCAEAGLVRGLSKSVTAQLGLLGGDAAAALGQRLSDPPGLAAYGSEQNEVLALPGATQLIGAGLTEAMLRFAARYEYALTVEDVLARRSRCLFLDARLALNLAPKVAQILAAETGLDPQLDEFLALAPHYLLN